MERPEKRNHELENENHELEHENHELDDENQMGFDDCCTTENEKLSKRIIKQYLWDQYKNIPIHIKIVCDSTNNWAKKEAMNEVSPAQHGSIFLSEKQTDGRGRRGKSFLSLEGSAIYFSMLLKSEQLSDDILLITTAASVAVYRAILSVTGKKMQIKWVNDIFYNEKKICGILTEAVTNSCTGKIESLIVGIGVNFNVSPAKIPEELKDIVGTIYEGTSGVSRNHLIAEIANQLLEIYMHLKDRSFLEDYKQNSMILGEEILVISADSIKEAKAVSIDEMGGLVVQYPDNTFQTLNTGEITIRKKMD